jgi:acyl-CoA synthetase (AMP-forming)/AMP-acid ligase II
MNCIDYFFENSSALKKHFITGKEKIAFDELYSNVCRLAGFIRSHVGENKNILLLSVNNVFFVQAYLAIMKSGNTCVPLDPRIEEDNLRYIKEQTSPDLVFLTPDAERRLAIDWSETILPDKADELLNESLPLGLDEEFDKERVAEIIFTSGSTGVPKGVMLSHKNLIANTTSIVDYLNLSADDRIMVVMPFFYCYGLSLFHTHLRVGGSMVLNNSFIFLGAVINDLKNNECTGFAGVPSHFQILLRKSETFTETKFPKLRYVTQAGGKLSPVFIDEFRDAFPDVKFYVMYGQTEATARLSYLDPNDYNVRRGSLGKGIPGVELKVVDAGGIPVKAGEIGEIWAKGDNIMKGYINDPESTAEVLVDGWLHTGDLATVDEDGFIYHSARKKEILKISGKRVSPKEIEEVILGIHEVVDCSIEAIEDEIQGEAIKATVVLNNTQETTLTQEQIKEHCSKNLALYKVPKEIEFKDRMELSSSGKKVKAKL